MKSLTKFRGFCFVKGLFNNKNVTICDVISKSVFTTEKLTQRRELYTQTLSVGRFSHRGLLQTVSKPGNVSGFRGSVSVGSQGSHTGRIFTGHLINQTRQTSGSTTDPHQSQSAENAGWLIRLALENGYLSWCRNAYITSMVGATTYLQTAVPYCKDAAFLFFTLGGSQLLVGTVLHLYYITTLRKRIHMSVFTALAHFLLSVFHVIVWVGAVAIYLGYIEEVDLERPDN